MDLGLSNADAATAIGAFLRRLRRKGRNPDRWEADGLLDSKGMSLIEARQTDASGLANLFIEAVAQPA